MARALREGLAGLKMVGNSVCGGKEEFPRFRFRRMSRPFSGQPNVFEAAAGLRIRAGERGRQE